MKPRLDKHCMRLISNIFNITAKASYWRCTLLCTVVNTYTFKGDFFLHFYLFIFMDVSYIKLTSICSSHQVSDCSKFLVSDSLTALYYVSESRYFTDLSQAHSSGFDERTPTCVLHTFCL